MKFYELLNFMSDTQAIEINALDSNGKCTILSHFNAEALRLQGYLSLEIIEILEVQNVKKSMFYGLMKNLEIVSSRSKMVGYDFTVIVVTLKLEEV